MISLNLLNFNVIEVYNASIIQEYMEYFHGSRRRFVRCASVVKECNLDERTLRMATRSKGP